MHNMKLLGAAVVNGPLCAKSGRSYAWQLWLSLVQLNHLCIIVASKE